MAASPLQTMPDASTLIGVVVGASMATLGSFIASWYERRAFRREREADAALVFCELLRTLAIRVALVKAAHKRGDPFGPITIRMARGVGREIDIYERNRERMFLVRDAALRPHASALMGRLTFALERVLDNTDALAARPPPEEAEELKTGREQAFEFLLESADELPALADRFAKLANTKLAEFDVGSVGLGPAAVDEEAA